MASDLIVVAAALKARAAAIAGTDWPEYPSGNIQPPCAIQPAQDAFKNLGANFLILAGHEQMGKVEGQRLHETLTNVATAYDTLDREAAAAVNGGPAPAPVPVAQSSTPALQQMPQFPALGAPNPGEGMILQTDSELKNGDQGTTLSGAADEMQRQADQLKAVAEAYKVQDLKWEGDAAEAADAKFTAFKNWVNELGDNYTAFAAEARKVVQAHKDARAAHDPIVEKYNALLAEMKQAMADGTFEQKSADFFNRGKELDAESQQVRNTYASSAATKTVQPDPVPGSSIAPTSVSANEHRKPDDAPGTTGATGGGPGGGGGGGGGGSSGGASGGASGATMPQSSGMQNAAQSTGAGQGGSTGSGGESAGGGSGSPSGGGGSPSGGGTGAGGGLPGGLPDGGTGMPPLPDDPSLHPAAADAGGGGGGSGGGGGGGLGPSPLQPNLGHSGVGPGPAGGAVSGGGSPGSASATGGMGMGGGAPMHGAGHGQGGEKEKKRNPLLTPDENIYAEEREWTEPVIGQRRRTVSDTSKDSK